MLHIAGGFDWGGRRRPFSEADYGASVHVNYGTGRRHARACSPRKICGHMEAAPSIVSGAALRRPTGRIWAMSPGNGVFVSADRGVSFAPLESRGGPAPKLIKHGAFAA